jgi:hypothetical protein
MDCHYEAAPYNTLYMLDTEQDSDGPPEPSNKHQD